MTIPEAIKLTLDKKWIPISEAKSIEEMMFFFPRKRCPLCKLHLICSVCDDDCLITTKRDTNTPGWKCCYEFYRFIKASENDDYPKALYWANQLVNKIKRLRKKYEN